MRAPSLRPAAPPAWGEPITLFNGVDLQGWQVIQGAETWTVVDGILTNPTKGGNLVTDAPFWRLQAARRVSLSAQRQQRHLPARPL